MPKTDSFSRNKDISNNNTSEINIIGIGASAGGLEALSQFFESITPDMNCAYVVVVHLSPDYKSMMSELLSKRTDIPVIEATQNMEIKLNHCYIIPSSYTMSLKDNHLILDKHTTAPKPSLLFPIDIFFTSLAKEKKENCIAIILSGTGSDGSKGIGFIKEYGGTVMVQDPKESKFDGMPNSAILTGHVDIILEIENMSKVIQECLANPKNTVELDTTRSAISQQAMRGILDRVKNATKIDFNNYKSSTTSRRILRRMALLNISTLRAYDDYLTLHPEEIEELRKDLLIGVTRFFRDTDVFEHLKKVIIPDLFDKHILNNPQSQELRIWNVACSSGEETYSLAMLFLEEKERRQSNLDVKIIATDIDTAAIDRASQGQYQENLLSEVHPELRSKYFSHSNQTYSIKKFVRDCIIFATHNALEDPPFNSLDLIVCRNMLIYLNSDVQHKLLGVFHYVLNPESVLLLGTSESLHDHNLHFKPLHEKNKIFKKIITRKDTFFLPHFQFDSNRLVNAATTLAQSRKNTKTENADKMTQALLDKVAPKTIVFNENFNYIMLKGNVQEIMTPSETPSLSILELLPKEFFIPISSGVNKIKNGKTEKVVFDDLVLQEKKKKFSYILSVEKLHLDPDTYYIATINEKQLPLDKKVKPISIEKATKQRIIELENELMTLRTNLQNTVEELEASNEELQTTNEELISTNEELQSTNEELQSVNEELYTVNSEHRDKIQQLLDSKDDMENLFRSTQISTIFLDNSFIIRKISPGIVKHFNIYEEDIGRDIFDFSNNINYETLKEDLKHVYSTLEIIESELKNSIDGHWYLMRMIPYRSNDHQITGVVMSFININEIKESYAELDKAQYKLKQLNQTYTTIIEGTMAGYWDWDIPNNIEYMSQSFKQMFGYEDHEIPNTPEWWQNNIHPEDLSQARDKFTKHVETRGAYPYDCTVRYQHKSGHWVWVFCRGKVIEWDGNNPIRMVGSHIDITDLKNIEEALRASDNKFKDLYQNTPVMMQTVNSDGNILETNQFWHEKMGYTKNDISAHNFMDFLSSEESKHFINAILKNNQPSVENYACKLQSKAGLVIDVLMSVRSEKTSESDVLFNFVMLDVTEEKQYQRRLEFAKEKLQEFAYVAAHDLKTPVNNLEGLVNIIGSTQFEKTTAKSMPELITHIKQNIVDLATSLDNIGYVIEQEDYTIQTLEKVPLLENCNLIIKNLDELIQEKKATIHIDVKKNHTALFNKGALQSILLNLISNALKYSHPKRKPEITIKSELVNKQLQLSVIDNGKGIPIEHQNRIFKLFQRGEEEIEGRGIGLYLVQLHVNNCEGELVMESVYGKGTKFTIKFLQEERVKKT